MNWLFRLYKRVRNLIRWYQVIWNDQDWDYGFIYDILEFKLKNMLKDTETWHMEDSRKVMIQEDIRICIKLIDAVKTDKYHTEMYDYVKVDIDFKDNQLNLIRSNDTLDIYFSKNRGLFKKLYSGETEIHERCELAAQIGTIKQQHAKDLLFKILHDRIEYWWD